MHFFEVGHSIRVARAAAGLTQSELARRSGLTRTTVNQVEAGVCPDLGAKKLARLLDGVGLRLEVSPARAAKKGDFLRMACTSANVSLRQSISPDELADVLLTGKVAREYRPHLRVILEEVPATVIRGMVEQVAARSPRAERIADNLREVARIVRVESEVLDGI